MTLKTARAAALSALLVAVIAIVIVVRSSGRGTYTLHAVFAGVNGLVTTGNVEVAGFKVGRISGISVAMGGYPRVTMEISDGYRVRRGAHAVIELGSLAGQLNRYIALSGGLGPPLPDGATIPLSRTSGPVEIDQFLSALTPRVRAQTRQLLHESVFTLRGHGDDIRLALSRSAGALNQAAGVLGDVAADGPGLRLLVTRAAQGAKEVASEPADVQEVIGRLSSLLTVTARRQVALRESLQRLPGAMSAANAALNKIDTTIPVFSRLIAAAAPALDAVDPFARQLRSTAPLTVPVLRDALSLLGALRQSSPSLARLFGPPLPSTVTGFTTTLDGVNPVLDQLRARAPDALGWFPLDGNSAANYDANGHGGLILAFPHAAPRRPVKSPTCGPGWLLRPFDRLPGQLACDTWTDYYKTFIGGGQPDSAYLTNAQQQPWPGEFGGNG